MLVARSVPLNNCCESEEEQTLDRMDDKDGVVKIKDVEEGEISDSASVEEISEEDFKKQEVAKVVVLKESPKIDTRVWTMQDLFSKYPMSRGYATGLYNFAWAQAVQNKPLNEVYAMDVDSDESSKRSLTTVASSSFKEESKVINVDSGDEMDVKMEECVKVEEELEEGEIDLDSEPAEMEAVVEVEVEVGGEGSSDDSVIESELEKKVNSILEELESVSAVEAEKSFEGVCSRLHNTLESVQAVLKNIVPRKKDLIRLSFCAIQAVNSVFCSFNYNQKEQNKEVFTRLINLVINQDPPIFSSERIKEVEAMVPAPNSTSALLSDEVNDKNKEKPVIDVANQHDPATSAEDAGQKLNSSRKFESYLSKSDVKMLSEASKPGQSSFRGRGGLAPLLDLHKDHDSDSLPSPTRENPPFAFAPRSLAVGEGMPKQEFVTASRTESATTKVVHGVGGPVMHPYETEAVKAVSSYQQKFGRTSFFSNDTLPSPTPSEESDKGEGDISGEVSSSYTVANVKNVDPPIVTRPTISPATHMNSSNVQGLTSAISSGHASSVSNPSIKAPAKSRDPRLRFASSSAMDFNQNPLPVVSNAPKVEPSEAISRPRRGKSVPDPILDGPALKRQRNGPTNTDLDRDMKIVAGSGGWLEDTGTVGPRNDPRKNHLIESTRNDPRKMDTQVTWPTTDSVKPTAVTCGIEQVPIACTSTTSTTPALPDILKDLAVNPTMLLNLLKMGQQQMLAAEAQQKSANNPITTMHPPSSISISGAVPLANVASLKPLILEQKPAETVQVPSEAGPKNLQDDVGKIRMKPRDPRRFLHSNSVQKSGNLMSEQFKTNGPPNSVQKSGNLMSEQFKTNGPPNSVQKSGNLMSEQFKTNGPPNMVQKSGNLMSEQFKTNAPPALITQGSMDNVTPQNLEDQADTSSMTSQPVAIPDISRQFTKSLKNIADLVSSSQPVPSSVASPSLPVQANMDKIDTKVVNSESEELQSGTGPVTGEGVIGPLGSQNTWGDVQHLFEGYDDQQKAAIQKERTRRLEEQEKMFAARKLCLVLDLDHTLLNSAKFIEVDPMHDEILRKKEEQDREKPQRHLYRFPHMAMWTKLRPGIWNFLEKASKLFEMHLYTMGNKLYATEMAKILDPKGNLFAGRVISRGDDGDPADGDERVPKSKDLEGVLGMESGVVIIDDSIRVWPRNKLNLIVVERYTYFPCSRRQFGLAGPSLLEIDHDERLDDGTLASCSAVIERIHQSFFSHRSLLDADVRNILASEQQKILAGCRIVFSRVFPVGDATPHLHPLWQTAKQFGAVCTNQIDEQVTHVVANSLGTDKVNWALSTGRFVVHPGWVEASALLYRRANEQDFAIKP